MYISTIWTAWALFELSYDHIIWSSGPQTTNPESIKLPNITLTGKWKVNEKPKPAKSIPLKHGPEHVCPKSYHRRAQAQAISQLRYFISIISSIFLYLFFVHARGVCADGGGERWRGVMNRVRKQKDRVTQRAIQTNKDTSESDRQSENCHYLLTRYLSYHTKITCVISKVSQVISGNAIRMCYIYSLSMICEARQKI